MRKGRETGPFFCPFNQRSIGRLEVVPGDDEREGRLPNGLKVAAAALVLAVGTVPAAARAQGAAQADEIVVTAQRSGIPVWRVTSPTTTLVLIGSIQGVSKGTKWDPASLTETLRKADRVMFPNTIGVTASPFSLIGYVVKWRKQATLPKGQTLAQMLSPAQFRRLTALQQRGVLKPGFERKHPFHLALSLHRVAKGKGGEGTSADRYVQKAVGKYKIRTVPITSVAARNVVGDFFATPPQAYLACLMDSVALVEAGTDAVKARSDAWAERRVPAVLASPAERVYASCMPPAFASAKPRNLPGQVRTLLDQKPLTVAVIDLGSLARPGGVLDGLTAAGFDVRGPRWKG
jgi:uncharacterized protein YbaP (TraB family)